jgi:hypothetical protein
MFTNNQGGHATLKGQPTERRARMPHITVTANRSSDRGGGAVLLRERVSVDDFESDHFAAQLVERLGWAVSDADEVESAVPAGPSVDERAGEAEGDGVAEPDLVRERQPA